jgi:hypothetical protein
MKHYIYKLIQEETGFYYIGVRSCKCEILDDTYKGSMYSWKLTKEEKDLLKKEIINEYSTRDEANKDEEFIINQIKNNLKDPNCMNKHTGKIYCMLGTIMSEETKQKISKSKTGKKTSDETKLKQSLAKKGRKLSEEHKSNLRKPKNKIDKQTGECRKQTDEHRKKRSDSQKGIKRGPRSEETKEKIRLTMQSKKSKKFLDT